MISSYVDLEVYQKAYSLARNIFDVTRQFPKEELYSLTDQIRRSSRSIPVNIAEGWAKRRFENVFKRHLVDAIGSCDETKVWIGIAFECGYLSHESMQELTEGYKRVGRMLYSLLQNWQTYEK